MTEEYNPQEAKETEYWYETCLDHFTLADTSNLSTITGTKGLMSGVLHNFVAEIHPEELPAIVQ